MSLPPVVLDLQGAQSVDHRDRGVARFVLDHARAIERVAPGLVESFALNPDLPPPGNIEDLIATGRVTTSDAASGDALVHVMSPFELSIGYDRLLPPGRRERRIAVTLYDLVPDILADRYLADAGQRRRWRTRAELVRKANAVLAISACTARDGVERLGLSAERVTVIGTGTSAIFRPPADREAVRDLVRRRLPGLGSRWVLYTGGTDERKNVERLLEAWALLPEATRAEWQLVVACGMNDLQRNHLLVRADQLGFAGGLLVPGFTPDDVLVMLNQAADLAVFPALYEGYGLPVAEALACGTPAVASNTSSLPEILPPEALFDPTDAASIAALLDAALRDAELRATLTAAAGRPPTTWDEVGEATVAAYARLAALDRPTRPRPRDRARRLALVTPLPPMPTGVARFSRRLAAELARLDGVELEVLVDAPPHHRLPLDELDAPPGVKVRPLASLPAVERLAGAYDEVVYSVGNSEFHTGALAHLRRRPGAVLAHDIVLANLWGFAQWQHPSAVPEGFRAVLQGMYEGLPEELGATGSITAADIERWGAPMARDLITASTRYIVTSAFAAEWARLDARPGDRDKIATVPFPLPAPHGSPEAGRSPTPLIATFGLVDEAKQPSLLVDAFALLHAERPSVRLVFVGPVEPGLEAKLRARAASSAAAIDFSGQVDAVAYEGWLERAWIAVQLRSHTNGEASAAAGDCLAAALPLVATAIGANRDLPPTTVELVPRTTDARELGTVIGGLLDDPERRRQLAEAGLRYASERSFRATAAALVELLLP